MNQLSSQTQSNLVPDGSSLMGTLRQRVRQGNLGPLPVLIGLALIAIVFQLLNDTFLTPVNLTNLMKQIAATGTISVGVVLVLLLGEVDLSVGAVSGFSAAIMAVLSVNAHWPALLAIAAGIVVGGLIGLLQGFWIATFRVPSFVVSLAGLLAWQGALLRVLGTTGTVNLTDPLITNLANALLPVWLGWVLGLGTVGLYALLLLREHQRRRSAELPTASVLMLGLRIGLVALATLLMIGLMSINRNPNVEPAIRGVPMAVVIFAVLLIVFDYVTQRMRFGRYVFAVGGNIEAARRAGINVTGIRISVFMLASALAACGGILAGSRLYAVNQSSGSGDVLLNAIAAAVIGGTSLFGGRGRIWSALLGALVIGSIANGMDLLALPSSIKFMVTGAVLLAAVTIDAVTRSRRETNTR